MSMILALSKHKDYLPLFMKKLNSHHKYFKSTSKLKCLRINSWLLCCMVSFETITMAKLQSQPYL